MNNMYCQPLNIFVNIESLGSTCVNIFEILKSLDNR